MLAPDPWFSADPSSAADPPAAVASRVRRATSVRPADVAAAAGWVLFVGLWWRTLTYTPLVALARIGLFVAVAVGVTVAANTLWIRHNLRIHRRKGPRRSVPVVEMRVERDFSGRVLDADWEAVRDSNYVLVAPTGDRKMFRVVDGAPLDIEMPVSGTAS